MARPKKEPAETKTIQTGFADYMRMQNFLAQHLQVQQSIASRLMTAASSQLGAINATLAQVQNNTKAALQLSQITEKDVPQDDFPHIHNLLMTDPAFMGEHTEGLGELQLPLAPPLPTPAKKQRKQRAPKDPNAPKRPVTAFFLYLAENREQMTKQMGPDAKPGEIQQRNKDMWNSLTEEKQEKYKKKYRENFDQYRRELDAYKAKGGKVDPKELEPAEDDDAILEPAETKHAESSSGSSEEEEPDSDSDSDSDSSEAPSPQRPKKERKSTKITSKPSKEPSPEKKKKAEKEEKKKKKADKEKRATPSTSPEAPKKKRKAEAADAEAGVDEKKKKKKSRKSQGYAGNSEDF